jgi:hypothetical protein
MGAVLSFYLSSIVVPPSALPCFVSLCKAIKKQSTRTKEKRKANARKEWLKKSIKKGNSLSSL